MHGDFELILTLAGGLAAALVFGYITQRLKLSPLVGYLLAGIAVGPFTPGFIADHEMAEQSAEIGIILLMFGVGLSFHLKELLAVRRVALPGALVQITAATGLGLLLATWLGWSNAAGIVFGLAISVASTVVLIRVLSDNNDLHTPAGHIAVGWLVVEDLFTVLALVLLPVLAGGAAHGGDSNVGLALLLALGKISLLVALTFVLGSRAIPWLLRRVAATGSRELFTLSVLAIALGIAVGSAELFGVSMALGAFLAGMVVGRSEFSLRAAAEALPMRDAFAVLFFVSVGMLFDPAYVLQQPWALLGALAIVVIGKPLAAVSIVLLLGYPLRSALAVAVALAQIGEFSFILAALGTELAILPAGAENALIGAAIVSISINPLLYRALPVMEKLLIAAGVRARSRKAAPDGSVDPADSLDLPSHRAIIIGHGPVGQTLSRLLRENSVEPVVIDLNIKTVRSIEEDGGRAVYGDATHIDVLRSAGVERAAVFIVSAANMRALPEIIRQARQLNPRIRVLVRAAYLHEIEALHKAGADSVFSEEGEVALAMMESVLAGLGATPEQIDRERERVHEELDSIGASRSGAMWGFAAGDAFADLPPLYEDGSEGEAKD